MTPLVCIVREVCGNEWALYVPLSRHTEIMGMNVVADLCHSSSREQMWELKGDD